MLYLIFGAGKGIFQYFLLVVCGMCLMMVIVETLNVGFVVTMAECDLDLTTAHKGLLNGAAFLGEDFVNE